VKVRFTIPALDDLEEIAGYLASRSPQGARKVLSRMRALAGLLPEHPRMGTRTDDPSIRRLVVTPYPYLIFYEIGAEEIIIHAVRHAAREPSSMPGSA